MKKNNWVYKVFLWTFILSTIFSFSTNYLSSHASIVVMILIILLVIAIGIIFDMIGASSLTSKESTFHSMNAKKIKGAKETIKLIKNNVKISSICNDIVGDVCGIISGGLGAVIAISLSTNTGLNNVIVSVLVSAFISSLTVGGKAIFKSISIKNADSIIFGVGKVKHFLRLK